VVSSLNSFSTCLTLSFNSGLLAVASSWSWNLLSGGSAFYDNTISDTVKSTLNNWFSDTPEQKQQKFNIIIDGSSSEFKQALEAESGKTLEQIKQETDFNTNKNIPETPVWVDDALTEINQNPLNKFQNCVTDCVVIKCTTTKTCANYNYSNSYRI
jgi:hypothetical protein